MKLVTHSVLVTGLVLCVGNTDAAHRQTPSVALRVGVEATLEWVAGSMGVTLREDEPVPAIRLASETPLKRFQDAVAPQWHFRPPRVFNAYVVATNEIYLDDTSGYYARRKCSLDDSLAHELVHYLQVRYRGDDLSSDAAELEAVTVQREFRERTAAVGRARTPRDRDDRL